MCDIALVVWCGGLIPDTVAYTTLMEAHARAGEMTRARGYFAEMESFEQLN